MLLHSGQKCYVWVACLWSKMPMLQRVEMREGGEPLLLAFQYLILMLWRLCDLNLVMISSLASKCQYFKLRVTSSISIHKTIKKQVHIPSLKTCYFKASENSITKLTLQALHVIRIKYWKAGWSGCYPSFIPVLCNKGTLLHKQATLTKHFDVQPALCLIFTYLIWKKSGHEIETFSKNPDQDV